MMEKRFGQLAFVSLVTPCLIVAAVAAVAVGSTHVDFGTCVRVVGSKVLPFWIDAGGVPEEDAVIVWLIRLPRVLVAASVGAGLGIAGAMIQGLFRNPLAEPNVIGVGAGSSLGAVTVLMTGLYGKASWTLPAGAFLGGMVSLAVLYALAARGGTVRMSALLLAGIALALMLNAITLTMLSLGARASDVVEEAVFWMMGGLHNRSWMHVWLSLPLIAAGSVLAMFHARDLDLLIQGEETAAALGVEVERSRKRIMAISALLTGAAVAVAGPVAFVGLIVPHAVRLFVGPSHWALVPFSALAGAAFVIGCDLLARLIHPPVEIRLGIITASFGTPFFLLLLMRKHREINP
jgi:iron complex transport system permease protein